MDSIPIIAITGQVPTFMVGTDAFQEADMIGITQPITKQSYFLENAEDIPRVVKEAFYIAKTGRPGPVLIDFPKDIQNQLVDKFEYPKKNSVLGYNPNFAVDKDLIMKTAKLISEAKKPLILAGHGVLISNAMKELFDLVSRTGIPVVTTLHGISAFPENHELALGMLGMHGVAYANLAIQESDLILALGLRFDDRIVGTNASFAPNAKIVHVDIDPAEIKKNVHTELPIIGDVRNVLSELNKVVKVVKVVKKGNYKKWLQHILDLKKKYPLPDQHRLSPEYLKNKLSMRAVIHEICKQTKGDAVVVSDVGQHQMLTAQQFQFKHPHYNLTSGGSGTMGFSLPASMGAKVALKNKEVWCIVGDGSVMMNIQELVTLAQDNIPIKIAILNNSYLGMVRQWQELFFDKNYSQTKLHNPDFKALAEACGLQAFRARNYNEMIDSIKKMRKAKSPVLCDFVVELEENVYPMVPAGKSLSETITGLI
jgi:acetolactate synthase-1/2/3 large subunit